MREIIDEKAVQRMVKKDGLIKTGLNLWDKTTQDLEQIQSLLLEGKSELATIHLQEKIKLMNGQSREFLFKCLRTGETSQVSN